MQARLQVLVLLLGVGVLAVSAYDWSGAEQVLEDAIEDGAFPGCVAAVAKDGVGYSGS